MPLRSIGRLLADSMAAALAISLVLAGCVEGASEAPGAGGASILGGWELAAGTTCLETLDFQPGGRFAHGVTTVAAGWPFQRRLEGSFVGETETDAEGNLPLLFVPERAAPTPQLTHCAQWAAAGAATLPLAALAGDGVDAPTLSWRPVALAGGAWGWVGTDPGDADRLLLLREGNLLRGFLPDAGLSPGVTLYHRDPSELPAQSAGLGITPLLHLPQQSYTASFPAATAGASLQTLLLVLHSAADVTFGPEAGPGALPACDAVAWDGPLFTGAPLSPDPLAGIGAMPTVPLNPGDPAGPLIEQSVINSNGIAETLYLLPVEIRAPAAGECALNIRARPLVARLAAEHTADPEALDAFTVALQSGPAFLLGQPAGQPGALGLVPLAGGEPWALRRLLERVLQPPQAGADPLGLSAGTPTDLRASVQGQGGTHFLNLFPAPGGGSGLGPFGSHVPTAAPMTALLPGTLPLDLADATPIAARFALTVPSLVELYTDGGAETLATLRDAQGTPLAAARGGSAAGAGFRLALHLPAGSYDLWVQAAAPPVVATLHLAQPAAVPGLADGPLAACLHAANAPGAPPADLRTADCRDRGIASLTGIGGGSAYGGLQALRLDDNPLTDLAPLSALPELAVLSLAGTAPADLAPLAGLPRLHRLTLARAPLDLAARDVLAGLGTRLTHLNLAGATGLTPEDVTLLKAALPNTLLIAPDGTAYE